MAHFISDHTPMDDYQRLRNQAAYFIDNVDYEHRLPYNNRKNLDKSPAYQAMFRAMKIMLLIFGLSLPVSIIIFWIYSNHNHSNTLRLISMCSIFMVVGAFVLALLIGCVGAYMESHSEKKDKKTKKIQESETWVLFNGSIVVAFREYGGGGQMTKRYVMNDNHIVDVPFSRMDIIDRVHLIRIINGKIIAVADATEYYMKHPYVNEYPGDNISHYFHYYQKRVHRKIEWNENMLGMEKLINALKALKR